MEDKKKRNSGWTRKIIIGVLVVILIISGAGMVKEYLDGKKAEDEYKNLASMVQTTEESTKASEPETEPETEETTAYESPIDFEALRKINPDTIGWIKVPDTNIDYPIVWRNGDNDTYLSTDFEGNSSKAGAVYLDMDSTPDFTGHNNLLYGHNMKNGSMFKDVVKYKDKDYFKAHQYFQIYTPERTINLKAVSCYYDKAEPIVRKTRFKTRQSYNAFLKEMITPCEFAEMPDVDIDSLFVLVTCSYEVDDARTFVFAVEVDEDGNVIASEDPEAGFLDSPVEGTTGAETESAAK